MLGDGPVETDELFLVTQFTAPAVPSGMVERARLSTQLHAGLALPVTLVCAPPGSGKTSLLSSVLGDAAPMPVAWLSLEPGDDVPVRFWEGVLKALRKAAPQARFPTPVRESIDAFPPLLVNALAELPKRIALVLDDLHLVRSRQCLTQLGFLVLHAPPTVAVVLSTRADPPLPLHVLRVRGLLAEIRADDLAFTTEEATALLSEQGVELAQPLVSTLRARCEGWAAGLRLAGLNLRGADDPEGYVAQFAGSDGVVGDYLVAEVLEQQPPKVRRFLLQTSILEQMSGELVDAVTGAGNGAMTLDALERTNGFVQALDRRGEWFRYHRLLASLLRARAKRELGGEVDELHRRAARWYAERGMYTQALHHAVAGDDGDLGLDVLGTHWFELFVDGRSEDIRALIARVPVERVRSDPDLAGILACTAFAEGDETAAVDHLADARAATEEADAAGRRQSVDPMAIAELCAACAGADFERGRVLSGDLLANADGPLQAFVHACLGQTALRSHRLNEASEELQQSIAAAGDARLGHLLVEALGHLALRDALMEEAGPARTHASEAVSLATDDAAPAAAHLALALTALSGLRPDEAEHHLQRAARGHGALRGFETLLAHAGAELHAMRGHADEGLRMLDSFEMTGAAGTPAPYETAALGCMRARLHAAVGDLDAADRAIGAIADEPWLMVAVVRARLLLASGDPEAAIKALEDATAPAILARTRIERLVLYAVALDQVGDSERAGKAFEDALALAEPSGHRWAFVAGGSHAELLLRDRIRRGTTQRGFVSYLLDSLSDPNCERATTTSPPLEPLTEREEAVLRYLPTSLSNSEMAAELFISTNTVKTHLRSIYRKLDVEHRREAVERARELSLLTTSRR